MAYKEKIAQMQILPLPMYIQINNILLLSKIGLGRYDDLLSVSDKIECYLISVSDKIECVKLKQESSDEYQITKMSNQTQFILVFWL